MSNAGPGNTVVSWIKTPKTLVQQYMHRRPDSTFSWHFGLDPVQEQQVESRLDILRENGIALFPRFFKGEILQRLQAAFERALTERKVETGNRDSCASNDFMDLDPVFAEAATHPLLLEIISRYYGKKFALGRVDATRIEPTEPGRSGSFQWHHDSRGKQVKAQIMLTDVTAEGQRMTYLKKSHLRYYRYGRDRGEGSRFEIDLNQDPEAKSQVLDVTGVAGTVGLFDTNGLHSGNRNPGPRRDTLTFYYPTPESRNYDVLRYRQADIQALDEMQRTVIVSNPNHRFVDSAG